MRITIVAVGKLKERHWREAAEEYLKRLRPYASLVVTEVADRDVTQNEARALADEGADILRAIPENAHVVVLDLNARQMKSEQLADWMSAHALERRSSIAFVIGGAAGLSAEVMGRANERISLGAITLPHQLARVVLLEQVYRSFRIMRKEPYHR